jgi:hypothetical protein
MWRVAAGTEPSLYTDKDGWKYLRIWGMGIAGNDLDGDTYPEYFLTSMADNKLQTLIEVPAEGKPKPGYKDIAYVKGVTAHRPYMGDDLRPSTGWHTQFEDVNNDGYVDLFIAKGNVAKMPDFAEKDPNNLLVQGADGEFAEAGGTSGVGDPGVSRGAALADFNLDGLVDLLVVNRWETAKIWRNTTEGAGNWVQLKLQQPDANRNAVGAWIEVKSGDRLQRREITVGGGHVSGQAGWIHFGIGAAETAEIRVQWPGGEWSEPYAVAANGFSVLERGKAEATPWQPK